MAASSSSFSSTPTPTAADHAANNSNALGAGGGINGGLSSESAFGGGNMLPYPSPSPANPHIAAHLRYNTLLMWQSALSDHRFAHAIVEREVSAHDCNPQWRSALTNGFLAKHLIQAECEVVLRRRDPASSIAKFPPILEPSDALLHLLHPLPQLPQLSLLPLPPQLLMLPQLLLPLQLR